MALSASRGMPACPNRARHWNEMNRAVGQQLPAGGEVLAGHASATNPHLVPVSKQSEYFVVRQDSDVSLMAVEIPALSSYPSDGGLPPRIHTARDVVLRGDDERADARARRVR